MYIQQFEFVLIVSVAVSVKQIFLQDFPPSDLIRRRPWVPFRHKSPENLDESDLASKTSTVRRLIAWHPETRSYMVYHAKKQGLACVRTVGVRHVWGGARREYKSIALCP